MIPSIEAGKMQDLRDPASSLVSTLWDLSTRGCCHGHPLGTYPILQSHPHSTACPGVSLTQHPRANYPNLHPGCFDHTLGQLSIGVC